LARISEKWLDSSLSRPLATIRGLLLRRGEGWGEEGKWEGRGGEGRRGRRKRGEGRPEREGLALLKPYLA